MGADIEVRERNTPCATLSAVLPEIEKVADEHKQDLIVWGMSLDQPSRDKKWLTDHQQVFPTLFDSDYVASDSYEVHGIPAVILMDRKGVIQNYWQSEVPAEQLENALNKAVYTP